jgi:hypothetical protein
MQIYDGEETLDKSWILLTMYHGVQWIFLAHHAYSNLEILDYTPAPRRGRGVYCFTSVRPSKIFFVAFFSVTVDGRNLIFGHKCHIGIPYCGKRFWTRQIPTSCLPTLLIFIYIEHICSFFVTFFSATIDGWDLIFGHKLHMYPISWEAFLDPSDSYFLFADFVDFYTHWTYILYMSIFSHIFLSNFWWQKSDIIPPLIEYEWGLYCNHLVRPFVRPFTLS